MGDRGNVCILQHDYSGEPQEKLFIYSHDYGSILTKRTAMALEESEDRWDDLPYFNRIMFDNIVSEHDSHLGWGLSLSLTDYNHDTIVVDPKSQRVWFTSPGSESFEPGAMKSWDFSAFIREFL